MGMWNAHDRLVTPSLDVDDILLACSDVKDKVVSPMK